MSSRIKYKTLPLSKFWWAYILGANIIGGYDRRVFLVSICVSVLVEFIIIAMK